MQHKGALLAGPGAAGQGAPQRRALWASPCSRNEGWQPAHLPKVLAAMPAEDKRCRRGSSRERRARKGMQAGGRRPAAWLAAAGARTAPARGRCAGRERCSPPTVYAGLKRHGRCLRHAVADGDLLHVHVWPAGRAAGRASLTALTAWAAGWQQRGWGVLPGTPPGVDLPFLPLACQPCCPFSSPQQASSTPARPPEPPRLPVRTRCISAAGQGLPAMIPVRRLLRSNWPNLQGRRRGGGVEEPLRVLFPG